MQVLDIMDPSFRHFEIKTNEKSEMCSLGRHCEIVGAFNNS